MTELSRASFASSEGQVEGDSIAVLASRLSGAIDDVSVFYVGAVEGGPIVAAILFTALFFDDNVRVFMFAPVAVLPLSQRRVIGGDLIFFGLGAMQQRGVEIAVTYGDPAF